MIRSILKCILSLCLVASLLLGSTVAFGQTAGLDTICTEWIMTGGTVHLSATMEIQRLLPFTDVQLPMFNDLLKHTVFHASLQQEGEDTLMSMQVAVGDQQIATLVERQEAGNHQLETTLLPKRVLQSTQTLPTELLFGMADTKKEVQSFDFLRSVSEVEGSYQALIDACAPYAEKKRANYKIKNIGTSKWSQIARLTVEQSDSMLPLLRTVLGSGMDEAYRRELEEVRFGKGFIVGLYKESETGRDMALYMKGNLLYPDGSICRLSYQWAFVNNGTERKDAYKYETVKDKKPADNRTIAALVTQKLFSDLLVIRGTSQFGYKGDGVNTEDLLRIELEGKAEDTQRTLVGSVSLQRKDKQGEETTTTLFTLSPNLTLSLLEEGEHLLSGSVMVEDKHDKIIRNALTFTLATEKPPQGAIEDGLYTVQEDAFFDDSSATEGGTEKLPASSLSQNIEADPTYVRENDMQDFLVGKAPIGLSWYTVPKQDEVCTLTDFEDSVLPALQQEAVQNLAAQLLRAYSQLPPEDTTLLRDGMTDEDYEAFLSLGYESAE